MVINIGNVNYIVCKQYKVIATIEKLLAMQGVNSI